MYIYSSSLYSPDQLAGGVDKDTATFVQLVWLVTPILPRWLVVSGMPLGKVVCRIVCIVWMIVCMLPVRRRIL